ncbi:MAG: DUF3347 domain-containing protein [Ferruginibacter sp.]|nr:DUF3347 domain-containing protein [Ferruginibacter sp.]
MVAILTTILVQTGFAQHDHATHKTETPALLPLYYSIKDALVSGNANLASSKANELVIALNTSEAKAIAGSSGDELLKHAGKIAQSKDLKSQRANFADLSESMVALAKNFQLSTEPIYQMYCPMKKANWLSSSSSVKNPYFGNAMLTCGKVVETLK